MHAGGSPAASSFSCAAKKRNQKKAAPVSRPLSGVPLCCLTRQGGCGTRPGRAHTTCPAMGLEQSSPTAPCRVELLGTSQGEISTAARRLSPTANPSAHDSLNRRTRIGSFGFLCDHCSCIGGSA